MIKAIIVTVIVVYRSEMTDSNITRNGKEDLEILCNKLTAGHLNIHSAI